MGGWVTPPPFRTFSYRNRNRNMNNDELFNIVGRLYVDIYNTQKYIEILQKQIQDKDSQIQELQNIRSKDE